ncbi:cytochrome c oxidase subunit 3 [Candidatus Sumerlaeota bacterium]|nr:cytochrome c oxidase subunit 3 [Candidatus Sumerlaeota bacterium]
MSDVAITTPDAAHAHSHEHAEHIHLPDPSLWPFLVAMSAGIIPVGILLLIAEKSMGGAVLGIGIVFVIISALGWCTSVIREKPTLDSAWANRTLSMGWKLFLVSEGAIFGAFFGHLFYIMYHWHKGAAWPPAGTPPISLIIPAIGTGLLVTSSVTCEMAHKFLLLGRRGACKSMMVLTMALGLIFLTLQALEWGVLGGLNFAPHTNIIGTLFYLITGFHGFHVLTGMMFLFLVYARLEFGSFDRSRHFSMNAASWYWHFVDVIWLLVFFTLYVGIQPAAH